MKIQRYLLLGVVVLGLLAAGRLGWVVRDYTRGIAALRGLTIQAVDVARTADDTLRLHLRIQNDSDVPLQLQSLQLNLYDSKRTSIGATYERSPRLDVDPWSQVEIEQELTILYPDRLPPDGEPWRMRGEVLVGLPFSDRFFKHGVVIEWREPA